MIISYLENTPYGRHYKQKGLEGAIQSFQDRKHIELDVIKTLPIKTIIIENNNYDWEKVWQDVEYFLRML